MSDEQFRGAEGEHMSDEHLGSGRVGKIRPIGESKGSPGEPPSTRVLFHAVV